MTIQVHHKIPVTVETTEVELPYYFKENRFLTDNYYAVLEDFTVIQPYYTDGNYVSVIIKRLKSAEEVGEYIEGFFKDGKTKDATEQEFKDVLKKAYEAITSRL